jgi:GNAT superfamily N-acetyltransferase
MPRDLFKSNSTMSTFTISDLRQCPEFFDLVADRIWHAWWKARGYPLDHIRERLTENMNQRPIPLALVAHDGGRFLGTASAIASDLEERPQFSPWVAAVWVEPTARRRGIGAMLVDRAAETCFALGVERAYLCARAERAGFYERLGWRQIENDVGQFHLGVFIRDASPYRGSGATDE